MGETVIHRPRFIPTHVGNAFNVRTASPPLTVHPHARGERHGGATENGHDRGSSPRTWGTRRHRSRDSGRPRFIPTHVGNAWTRARMGKSSPVHPHARGERVRIRRAAAGNAGSSPRTWGTLPLARPNFGYMRFIPTHVGNAPANPSWAPYRPVHPHARGERYL